MLIYCHSVGVGWKRTLAETNAGFQKPNRSSVFVFRRLVHIVHTNGIDILSPSTRKGVQRSDGALGQFDSLCAHQLHDLQRCAESRLNVAVTLSQHDSLDIHVVHGQKQNEREKIVDPSIVAEYRLRLLST